MTLFQNDDGFDPTRNGKILLRRSPVMLFIGHMSQTTIWVKP
jgi:hypothetical protein